MKILHVYKRSFPESMGGVEKFIDTLCKSISAFGVKNEVLSLSRSPSNHPIKLEGYNVHHAKEDIYKGSTGFSLQAFFKFKELSRDVDIIHHHYPHPFGDLLQIFSFTNKPYIVTYHSDILRQKNLEVIYNPLKHFFLKRSHKIIATSPNYYATSEILQRYSSKVEIVPIGLSAKDYENPTKEKIDYWKKKLGMKFFLFVGAQRYYKGLKVALKAIEDTNIKLIFAGTRAADKELSKYAKSKSITNIKFLGKVSKEDKCALLSACYAFIFPSNLRTEAFGIALLEAAYFGNPLISCEIGTGTSFVNKHNETGLVVKPGCPKDLRDAMLKLLDNKELAIKMGGNAKKRAENLFTAEKQSKSYFKIYSEILKSSEK
ncbi:MAG: glycosyl transferase family 1 [Flavobacteriaceae bacterium]|nr:glycosyl transferase family 1 [Flavobacteriaceae bacterium]